MGSRAGVEVGSPASVPGVEPPGCPRVSIQSSYLRFRHYQTSLVPSMVD